MPKTWPRALLFYLLFFDLRTQFGVPKGVLQLSGINVVKCSDRIIGSAICHPKQCSSSIRNYSTYVEVDGYDERRPCIWRV